MGRLLPVMVEESAEMAKDIAEASQLGAETKGDTQSKQQSSKLEEKKPIITQQEGA
jgi:hypothetical protein